MSPEDQQKMQEALKKALGGKDPSTLSPEERQKVFSKLRESGALPGVSRAGASSASTPSKQGAPAGPPVLGPTRPGGGGSSNPSALDFIKLAAARNQFTEKDLETAKLPPPPEEESQLDVLLRPGLLADVEIIVEKIPNALHVPVQAVFDKNGKQIVFVQRGKKFEERPVQIAKRSESTMVLTGGVAPNDTVALADPFEKKSGKKGGDKKSGGGGGNPMGAVPGGGDSGGRKGGK
jgi:hypothetical protein